MSVPCWPQLKAPREWASKFDREIMGPSFQQAPLANPGQELKSKAHSGQEENTETHGMYPERRFYFVTVPTVESVT